MASEERVVYRTREILEEHRGQRGSLLPILHALKEEFGYIPHSSIDLISRELQITPNDIYGIITFYKAFQLEPPAEKVIHYCEGLTCKIRGSMDVRKVLQKEIQEIYREERTAPRFSLHSVSCFGSCTHAPLLTIDGETHARVTAGGVRQVLKRSEG